MVLKSSNPVTPSMRGVISVDKSQLHKGKPWPGLSFFIKSSGGRNNTGRITSRHRGGRHRRRYRIIDFKRNKFDICATVVRLEYDPNRGAFIALVRFADGEHRYILAPHGLNVGDNILSGVDIEIKIGNCLPLSSIPVGTCVHNIEMKRGKGGQLARSAGNFATLVSKDDKFVQLKLPSGEIRHVLKDCMATVGVISNADHKNISIGKAGRHRWLGIRPSVRGVAMNPVDHPHGGGEGKTSGGRHPVTPFGIGTKGKKTRKNKRTSGLIVKRRK